MRPMRLGPRRGGGWRGALVLSLTIVASVALAQAAPIKALRWLAPGADRARLLSAEPTECLKVPIDPGEARAVEIGRAAFRTPILLGGQAARAGLSCESCHRGGRDNPQFQFAGVSGPPGTADVTSSLFSSHRGDGAENPVPIPDLAGPRTGLKVAPRDLPGFIRGLIVEEFDGPEPSAAVLAGLAAYVGALSPDACPAEPRRPIAVAGLMEDTRRALAAARTAPDAATAATLVAAARARLGLIDERYATPALAADRQALRAFDQDLAAAAAAVRGRRTDADARLSAAQARTRSLEARLRRRESQSLFDFKLLSAAT